MSIPIDLTTPADHALAARLETELAAALKAQSAIIENFLEANPDADAELVDGGCTCPTGCAPCGWCESIDEEVFEAQQEIHRLQCELGTAKARTRVTNLPIRYVAEPTVRCEGTRANIFAYFFDMQVRSEPCTDQAAWRVKRGEKIEHLCDSCNRAIDSYSHRTREPIITGRGDESRLADARRSGWTPLTCAERIKDKVATKDTALHQMADGVDPAQGVKDSKLFEAQLLIRADRLLNGEGN